MRLGDVSDFKARARTEGMVPFLDAYTTFFRSPPLDFRIQINSFKEGSEAA
jgi:hypothetical protein